MKLEDTIFSIQNEADFTKVALEVYHFQVNNCEIYREFVQNLNWKEPTNIAEIPFLPISFFKSHHVAATDRTVEVTFKSSGTGGDRSQHFVQSEVMYKRSFREIYRYFIGNPEDQVILALLPNYVEQGDSSLVYMVDDLIQLSQHKLSGFVLHNMDELIQRYNEALVVKKQVVIFGVAYSLLDLCTLQPNLEHAIIIETGGMKGRRKELTKFELHQELRNGLNCDRISSEYGMTELLSQAYSNANGVFELAPWMKILIRETNDPFSFVEMNKTGGVNVIDLANLYSCSFIATQDLGKLSNKGFEIMGRFDLADLRGCNLLVQD
jgi:hypothetical protein